MEKNASALVRSDGFMSLERTMASHGRSHSQSLLRTPSKGEGMVLGMSPRAPLLQHNYANGRRRSELTMASI